MKIEGLLKNAVRVVPEVTVEAREKQALAQQKFGIGEILYLAIVPHTEGSWSLALGQGTLTSHGQGYPGEAAFACPAAGCATVKLEFKVGALKPLATVEFEVIKPALRLVKFHSWHWQSTDPNAGFLAAFVMTPDTVYFARVALRENGGANRWTESIDRSLSEDPASPNYNKKLNALMTTDKRPRAPFPILGKSHTSPDENGAPNGEGWADYFQRIAAPAGKYADYKSHDALCHAAGLPASWNNQKLIRTIGNASGTVMFRDRIFNAICTDPLPWLAAADHHAEDTWAKYYLDIPVHYKVIGPNNQGPGAGDPGTLLATNRHSFLVKKNGTLTVSKGPQNDPESVTYAVDAAQDGIAGIDTK